MDIFESNILRGIVAFVIVLILIGAAAWLVRRFGAARLAAGRGRQPRLAVIDAASIDGRRKLIIIRRDNVEHLLMIGGPSDVVVETNILRAGATTQRENSAPRANVDTLPRAVPLPDPANWLPQSDPNVTPRTDRPRAHADETAPIPVPPPPQIAASLRAMSEPPARPQPQSDPLIGLAAELSRSKFDSAPRAPEPPRIPMTANYPNAEVSIAPAAAASPDVHLAEMAQRLESALRRPLAQNPQSSGTQRPSATSEPKRMEPKTFQYPEQKATGPTNGPGNGVPGNGAPANSIYEDLEQEMASLLGRQSGKT